MPFVAGPLTECGHCVRIYAACLPIVPGVLVPALCRLEDAWFFVAAGVVALVLFATLTLVLRELPRPWSLVAQAVGALAIGAEACGFASLLRM